MTGGTSGIALATAQRLAAEAAHVFLTGRDQSSIDAAVATIGAGATGIRADVSNVDDLAVVADAIAARGHGLDVIFANAGGGEFTPLGEISAEQFNTVFLINVGGTLFTVQTMLSLLNPGASMVLAGSTAASNGTSAFSLYAATKAAIRSFGRTWATEARPTGHPGSTQLSPAQSRTPGLAGTAPAGQEARTAARRRSREGPDGPRGQSPTNSPPPSSFSPPTRAASSPAPNSLSTAD